MSPMQRYHSHVKPKDMAGSEVDNDPENDDDSGLNPHLEPCGGFKPGRVHFDAEVSSKVFVAWKTVHPDATGNCTLRLGAGLMQSNFEVIRPLDKSADIHGKFPCGRDQSDYDGKMIKLPLNLTCDECTIQLEWETKASGKLHMCSDIQILGGSVEDCAGQCTNGAVCMSGECQCRKGYSGKFCEIVEYAPATTNYTMYLKYFLFFIIMVLIIIGLLFAGYLLFKNADKVRSRMAELFPKREA